MPNHQLPRFANGFQKIFCGGAFLDGVAWSPEISYNMATSQIDLRREEATRRAGEMMVMEDNESAILARWSGSNSITIRTNGFGPNGRHSSRLCDYYFGGPPGGH